MGLWGEGHGWGYGWGLWVGVMGGINWGEKRNPIPYSLHILYMFAHIYSSSYED